MSFFVSTHGRRGPPTLAALSGEFTLVETAGAEADAGVIVGKKIGSTLALTDDAGGRVALSGNRVVRGATAVDFDTDPSFPFTVEETLAGATNSPRETILTLDVTNVIEVVLNALALDDSTVDEDQAVTINITGATSGSTITVDSGALPAGLTLNSGARTISGTPTTAGTIAFVLREVATDANPRLTALGITVDPAAVPANVTPPEINEASLAVGDSPTWTNGTWTNGPILSRVHELYADGVVIGGGPYASGAYELQASEEGADITVGEVATNAAGDSVEELSDPVGPVAAAPGFAITTPVLDDVDTPVTVLGDAEPEYKIDWVDAYPTGGGIGDTLRARWGTSEGAAAVFTPVEVTVDESWWIDGTDPLPDLTTFCQAQAVGTTVHFQVMVKRGTDESDWSAFRTHLIADGVIAAPGFTDLTGQTTSTRVWSSYATVSDLGSGAYARLTATGPLRVKYGGLGSPVVFEAGEEMLVQNTDQYAAGVDTSASTAFQIDNVISNRGVALETFSATTAGTPAITREADLVLWYDPSDLATMFQTITGTTAVSADTHPVGTLNDKSGNGWGVTATANSSVRPTYRTAGGLHWLTSDGTSQFLRKLNATALALGLGDTFTLAFAVKANPGTARNLFGLRGSTSGSPVRSPLMSSSGTAANGTVWYRAQDAVTLATGGNLATNRLSNAWDNTLNVVILVVSGGTATFYLDGVAGTPWSVSEGALDFTDTYNLGLFAAPAGNGYFACEFYQGAMWDVAFDAGEIAAETTRQGALQGRTI